MSTTHWAQLPQSLTSVSVSFGKYLKTGVAVSESRSCQSFTWYPQKRCRHCGSADMQWWPVAGKGKVFTWTVVRHSFGLENAAAVPFIVALMEFQDAPGVHFVTDLVGCDLEDARVGLEVEPVFQRMSNEITMPFFRLVRQTIRGKEKEDRKQSTLLGSSPTGARKSPFRWRK